MACDCKCVVAKIEYLERLNEAIQNDEYSTDTFVKAHIEGKNMLWDMMKASDTCFPETEVMEFIRDENYRQARIIVQNLHQN